MSPCHDCMRGISVLQQGHRRRGHREDIVDVGCLLTSRTTERYARLRKSRPLTWHKAHIFSSSIGARRKP